MDDFRLGTVEAKFADIVWSHAPVSTSELTALCAEQLSWKRTTTYTVLKRLGDKGLFKTENSIVTALLSRDEFYAGQSRQIVDENYGGSISAFIAAYASGSRLDERELSEIRRIIGGAAAKDRKTAEPAPKTETRPAGEVQSKYLSQREAARLAALKRRKRG